MAKWVEKQILAPERDDTFWLNLMRLFEALRWEHYPSNVTGEEIDNGDDSENARLETVEVPATELDVWEFLEREGFFDL